MNTQRVAIAARNNAFWCDAVCAAHGHPTRRSALAWWNLMPSPPFFPNLVTLDAVAEPAAVGALLEGLLARPRLGRFAVKDSFRRLDLAPLGFDVLFEASWIDLEVASAAAELPALRWAAVRDGHALAQWEAAWWRGAGATHGALALFPPALLEVPGLTLIAGHDGARIVAGCALMRTDGVVGLACAFPDGVRVPELRRELLAQVRARSPGLALVGYESDAELGFALSCGFERLGPLRVWLRAAATGPETPSRATG